MSKLQVTVKKETNELILKREFDAPRALVWKAYTDAELFAHWWGPRAFTTTVPEMAVRSGGVCYYVMHGTGDELKGTEYEGMESGGKMLFEEIKEPELIKYVDVFVDKDGNEIPGMPRATSTTTFEEQNGKTLMTNTTTYEKLEDLEKVLAMGVEQGTAETFDKLDEVLGALINK